MMPTRDDAWTLLCEGTESPNLRKHALAVEAAMRAHGHNFLLPVRALSRVFRGKLRQALRNSDCYCPYLGKGLAAGVGGPL